MNFWGLISWWPEVAPTECLCLVCFRDYLARRVPDTNLLFVIISPACPNCYEPASSKNLVQEPVEMALAGEFL